MDNKNKLTEEDEIKIKNLNVLLDKIENYAKNIIKISEDGTLLKSLSSMPLNIDKEKPT